MSSVGMAGAFSPHFRTCCRKSSHLIRSLIHHPFIKVVFPQHGKQALQSSLCRSRKGIELSCDVHKFLRKKVHSSVHCMASEGMHQGGSLKVDIGGSTIEIVGAPGVPEIDIRRAVDSVPFKHWLTNLKGRGGILAPATNGGASCSLKGITIQSVDMFGQRVGFVKFKAELIDIATGKMLPGIVFARGGAVGILILLACDGETYAVLTEQARVPVGRVILELPAGMLDDDAGDFVGTAAREVEEETGIRLKTSDLICLTDFVDESTGRKLFPSPGGCDEEITLMLYRGCVKREVIDSLQGQQTGLQDHGEFIRVRVVPYNTLWQATADSKVLAAITLYEMAKREGILTAPPNAPELNYL